jgi:hypothetical protein
MTLSLRTARFFCGKNSARFPDEPIPKIATAKQRVLRQVDVCNVKYYDPDDKRDENEEEKIFTRIGAFGFPKIRRGTRT